MPDLEPDTKHQQLSDTLTQDEQVNSVHNDKDLNCSNTENVEKVGIGESQQSESSSANRDETPHVAGALSLVSKYNSSSSSNDSD